LTPNGIIDREMTYDEYLADKKVKELREKCILNCIEVLQLIIEKSSKLFEDFFIHFSF
jgi:hypothetical protein